MRALHRLIAATTITGAALLTAQGAANADTNSYRDCSNVGLSALSCNDLLNNLNVLSPHDNNNITYRGGAPVAIRPIHYVPTPPVGVITPPPVGVTPCPRYGTPTPCPGPVGTPTPITWYPMQQAPTYGTVGVTPCPVGLPTQPPQPVYYGLPCDPCAGR